MICFGGKLLFGNPDRAAPRLSPDGRQLAFLAAGVRRAQRLGRRF
jgi:hypothetical protein